MLGDEPTVLVTEDGVQVLLVPHTAPQNLDVGGTLEDVESE
jgi:hypothetical protein